jgi:hypothetical protein
MKRVKRNAVFGGYRVGKSDYWNKADANARAKELRAEGWKVKIRKQPRQNRWTLYTSGKSNPPTRKGKTGRWMKVKAVKVVRNKGKLTVIVKR